MNSDNNQTQPGRVPPKACKFVPLAVIMPAILAVVVAGWGMTRLLIETHPMWLSLVIAVPISMLLGAVLVSARDIVDVWVTSAIIIIAVLMFVTAKLKTIERAKQKAPQATPAGAQNAR